jgi:pyruvate/2-oxoglutarate dehydrogenase complex dihydrolipoamide acyltransferase (E2) component
MGSIMKINQNYKIESFPLSRLFSEDIGVMSSKKHRITALIEVDVTDSRKKIRIWRRSDCCRISFNAWILKCIALAVCEYAQVHAFRTGKNKLVVFNDVDMSIVIERKAAGEKVPLPLVIRNVSERSVNEIYTEIEDAKNEDIKNESGFILGDNKLKPFVKLFAMMPQFFRIFIWKALTANPFFVKKIMGTVAITSVGNIGIVKGWAIPFSIHPLCIALGSIVKKPGLVKDRIEIREYLEMTILMDHDVIDGAPAARFVARLAEMIESGSGLPT